MTFIIRIKDLQAETVVGVYDWEQNKKRPVVLNLALEIGGSNAGESDMLSDTIDYAMIERRVLLHLENASYQLIEKLAQDIAKLVLSLDTRIEKVTVEADKPGALKYAKSVSIMLVAAKPL
jgi:FolB domain-containing protein